MKNKILSIILAGILASSITNIPFSENRVAAAETNDLNKKTIWVSPDGNDSHEGTQERPLATLDGARKKAAAILESESVPVEVLFRGGEYRMSKTVNFTFADSGTEENPVVYKAYNNEKVEFKGSIEVDASKGKQVTDEEILSRMYEKVHQRVVCFDLEDIGISASMIRQPAKEDGWRALVNGEVNGIYLNGKKQTVAEWPNGEGVYSRWEKAITPTTMQYTETQPNRWDKADDFWLAGYPGYDFYYVRQSVLEVDTEAHTITTYAPGSEAHRFISFQSRRWKAQNLLEEIDVPGEYYIDTASMKLYMYPSQSLRDVKMEISWFKDPMIRISAAENITFEGITFAQTRGIVMKMNDVKNIDIQNCTFDSVLSHAILIEGTQKARTDKDYWQNQAINGSYDCDITGNTFTDIGGGAIDIDCGNLDTLTPSNNVIKDNLIYHANYLSKNQCVVLLRGCGAIVENNNISKCPFQAIRFYGNDFIIRYNEIYDVNQESDDCGAIYCGRNTIQRGTEISYNFIHDLFTTEKLPYGFQSAIYWDDDQTGISAHHNIIKSVSTDLASNGSVDCNFSENISIDITTKLWHFKNGGYSVNHNSGAEAVDYRFSSYIEYPEIYYAKYPTLKELFKYRADAPELGGFNILKNNLAVDSCDKTTGTNTLEYGEVSGNLQLDECNDFVAPEKQDFRIKSDSETAKHVKGILTDEFDIEKIGLTRNVELNKETAPFNQIYPVNGAEDVQSSAVEFVWDAAFGATLYRLVIATDKELKNVVYDEEVPYTLQKVEGLESNKVYYWKVYAVNRSRDLLSEWESSSCVYSFKTTIYDEIDTTYLDEAIDTVSMKAADITESNETGEYPIGTKDSIQKKIRRAQFLKKLPLIFLKQSVIDTMTNMLSGTFNKLGMVNKGFLNISNYIDSADKWEGNFVSEENGAISIVGENGKEKQAGISSIGHTTGSCLYGMDMKLNTDNWAVFAFSRYTDMRPFSSANTGYSICMKDDVTELQLSTGTAHSVVETVEKSFANDGKYHHVEFGFIDIGIGNLVVLYVDGEPWFEHLDIFNTSVNTTCGFSMYVNDKDENGLISVKPASETSSSEEYEEMLKRNLYKAVKTVLNSFETQDDVALFKNGSNKIFTPKGVYDVSYAPNKMVNGSLMMTFDKVDEVFGVETSQENDKFYIINDSKKELTNVDKSGEYAMVSVAEIIEIMGRTSTWVNSSETLVDGDIIFMNNVSYLNKSQELMQMLEKYKTDYIFDEA